MCGRGVCLRHGELKEGRGVGGQRRCAPQRYTVLTNEHSQCSQTWQLPPNHRGYRRNRRLSVAGKRLAQQRHGLGVGPCEKPMSLAVSCTVSAQSKATRPHEIKTAAPATTRGKTAPSTARLASLGRHSTGCSLRANSRASIRRACDESPAHSAHLQQTAVIAQRRSSKILS